MKASIKRAKPWSDACTEVLAQSCHLLKVPVQDGTTALHYAASWGNVHAVRALLEAGASLQMTDYAGKTALHWAASAPVKGQDDFVREEAIKHGASKRSFILNEGM